MKLVFIIDNIKDIGGGEYGQFMYAKHLALLGHEVIVFAGDRNFLTRDLIGIRNLRIHYYPKIPILIKRVGLGKLNSFKENMETELSIIREIRKIKPDWIIGYLRESAIKATKIGKKLGIKTANMVFETPEWMKTQIGAQWEKEWSHSKFRKSWENTRKAYAESNLLLPITNIVGKKVEEWVGKKNITAPIYSGVDVQISKGKRLRDIDIIYIGRLQALKNVDELLEAISMTRKNYNVKIVGDGEDKQRLIQLAQKIGIKAEFTGKVTEQEKWDMLDTTRLLVFPSSFEGFGIPPLEALSRGGNVLCSNLPVFKEVYGDTVHYFHVHENNEMAKQINNILTGKVAKTSNPSKLFKKYTWNNAAKHIIKEFEKYEHTHIPH